MESNNIESHKRDKVIEELNAKLAKYESPDRNSGNSSTPPSKESIKDEAIRRTKTLRKPTDRMLSGQKRHEGTSLKMTQAPDKTEDVSANYCIRCGESLGDWEHSVELDPDFPTVWRNLALGYYGMGDKEKSLRYLTEVEALDNNHQGIRQFRTLIDAEY